MRQKGQQPLIHEQGDRGKRHAQPQRDGEHARRNAIQQRFCKQQFIVLLQSCIEASKNRHGTHAEQQRGCHEALCDRRALPAALEPALKTAAKTLDAAVEIQKRPHGGAEHHRDNQNQRVFALQHAADADVDHAQRNGRHDRVRNLFRDSFLGQKPDKASGENGKCVDKYPKHGDDLTSENILYRITPVPKKKEIFRKVEEKREKSGKIQVESGMIFQKR